MNGARREAISVRKVWPPGRVWLRNASHRSNESPSAGLGEFVGNVRRSRPKFAALPPKNRMSVGVSVSVDALIAPNVCFGAKAIGTGFFSASNSASSAGVSEPSTSITFTNPPLKSTVARRMTLCPTSA